MKNKQKQPQQGDSELTRGEESSVKGIDLMRVDQCEEIGVTQVPTVSGAALTVVYEAAPVKRKRGRPPRAQAQQPPQTRPVQPPPAKKEENEEDVCFICFDGGDLVLCDRRNCPKAYHPACIKRDEAFFRTTAKWNCGWHICGTCQKASSYMCYTCTFSVCKRCIKDADFVIVRGNMGLCGTCIKPIMLIENIAQGDNESVKVDFDDKLSWEYLFKIYWLCLKENLSLTVDELTKANNPWKEVPNTAPKVESRNDHTDNKAHSSGNSALDVAVNGTKRRRTTDSPTLPNKLDAKNPNTILKKLPGDTNWATKELLEFLSVTRDGDTSVVSQFEVQALLIDYIQKNNLRDPLLKSQVICDVMLFKLFGRQRVGHFEMLKLLESHFLIQEKPKDEKTMNGGSTLAASSQIKEEIAHDPMGRDRRRKIRRKSDVKVQNENLDAYAAIDVHNINLIYLRRKFLETLLDDINKIHEKVVGTILRIKVSGSDQKLDIHRLVQVVGTCKATAPYQLGAKTTDVMIEILNLDKREVISIDQLSDQNVTEDECKRLRQSIKCGLNKRLTVGDILKTTATLQAMRVSEALEAEILKFNHLRDRASENGHRKDLRECVEKLDLLKSPEERQRLLQEVPEVHTDPTMDPSHASSEDAGLGMKKQDYHIKAQSKGLPKKGDIPKTLGNNAQKKVDAPVLRSRTVVHAGKDDYSKVHDSPDIKVSATQVNNVRVNGIQETEDSEIWQYRDPTGKTQGPFSIVQLRRWKSSGHFPPYLRIWKAHGKEDESVLLTDALAGVFDEMLPQEVNPPPHDPGRNGVDMNRLQTNPMPVNTRAAPSTGRNGVDMNRLQTSPMPANTSANPSTGRNGVDMNRLQTNPMPANTSANPSTGRNGVDMNRLQTNPMPVNTSATSSTGRNGVDMNRLQTNPMPVNTSATSSTGNALVNDAKEKQVEALVSGSGKVDDGNSVHLRPQVNCPASMSVVPGCAVAPDVRETPGTDQANAVRTDGNKSTIKTVDDATNGGSVHAPNLNKKILDFPSPTPKSSPEDLEAQAAETIQSLSSGVLVKGPSGVTWSNTTTTTTDVATTTSNVVVAGGQLPQVTQQNAVLLAAPSVKPIDLAADHATATQTSENTQVGNSSGWPAIVADPDECDESVSDLLAEVEAMEQNGLPSSPTSTFHCDDDDDLTKGPEKDFFHPVARMSLASETCRMDISQAGILDNISAGRNSMGSEAKDIPFSHGGSAGPELRLFAPPAPISHDLTLTTTALRLGSETTVEAGSVERLPKTFYGVGSEPSPRSSFHEASRRNTERSPRGSQRSSGGGHSRDRQWWNNNNNNNGHTSSSSYNNNTNTVHNNRQWPYSSNHGYEHSHGAGAYAAHPPKGLKICKFYESGYCKKGASCSFWHP